VKLVVLDANAEGEPIGLCAGAFVVDMLNEILIGDDKRPQPEDKPMPEPAPDLADEQKANIMLAHLDAEQKAHNDWVGFHFPRHDAENRTMEDMLSVRYRASILLGSTGWVGFSPTRGYWHAKFEDLTPEGQDLYRLMERLNPGCSVHILTFLDT
jgi:hypothetical protein